MNNYKEINLLTDLTDFTVYQPDGFLPYGNVDVLLMSHNNVKITEEFLTKYVENTDQNLARIIWLDNGSSDNTREFLIDFFNKNIKNGVLIFSKSNLGVINGRNLLYKVSSIINGRGDSFDYLMFLDNDQIVYGDWLNHHLSVLTSSKADVVGVEAWIMSPGFMPIENIKTLNKSFSYVGCGGMLIKKEVVEKIGMFDERFNPAYFEDPDFIFRCFENGFKIAWNMKAKIIHKPHQTLGNIKNNERIKILQDSHKKFCEKWKGKKPPVIKQLKIKELD